MTTRVQMQETKDVGLLVYLDNEAIETISEYGDFEMFVTDVQN